MEAEEVACLEEKEQSRVGASMAARGHRSSGGVQCTQQREREGEQGVATVSCCAHRGAEWT